MPILLRTAGSRCEHITHTICSLVTDGRNMCESEHRLNCSGHIRKQLRIDLDGITESYDIFTSLQCFLNDMIY